MRKKEIINQFKTATGDLVQLLASLDDAKLNAKPAGGGWSAGQIGEHLLKSYSVADTLNGAVREANRPPDQKVEDIRNIFLNFDIKMSSPGFIIPSEGHIESKSLLSSLKTRIMQMNETILNKDLTLLCTGFVIPQFGEFTRLEWINFVGVHTRRHVYQLKNNMENAGFTANSTSGKVSA